MQNKNISLYRKISFFIDFVSRNFYVLHKKQEKKVEKIPIAFAFSTIKKLLLILLDTHTKSDHFLQGKRNTKQNKTHK